MFIVGHHINATGHILIDVQLKLFIDEFKILIVDIVSFSSSFVFLLMSFSLSSYQLFEHCFFIKQWVYKRITFYQIYSSYLQSSSFSQSTRIIIPPI